MQLLDGFLAFALTLAALATVVSVLVEILHRALLLRTKGLNQMLSAYYDKVLAPRLAGAAPVDAQGRPIPAQALKQNMIDTLVDSAIQNEIVGTWVGRKLHFVFGPLTANTKVTTEEFLLRLPQTDAFQALKGRAQAQVEQQLTELAVKYDEYGRAISDYFKRRAQVVSILIGILLGVFANIDGLRIYQGFVNDPVLREQIIAKLPEWESRIATAPPPAGEPKKNAEPQKPGGPGSPAAAPAEATRAQIDEVKASLERVSGDLATLAGMGLPIGWDRYPNCLQKEPASLDGRCRNALSHIQSACPDAAACSTTWSSVWATARVDKNEFLTWLFAAIVTGVLIGLGGPFWFDVARKLSQVTSSLRGKSQAGQPSADEAKDAQPDRTTLISKLAQRASAGAAPVATAKRRLLP
jgi:hypothetical protein